MKHLIVYKLFENRLNETFSRDTIRLGIYSYIYSNSFKVDFELYLKDDYIGSCEIETCFKTDDFKDGDDYLTNNIELYPYEDKMKLSDLNNHRYVIYLHGFEIEEEFQNRGLGSKAIKKIIGYIRRKLPTNDGVYLSVFENNVNAVKIYIKNGFKVVRTETSYDGNKILVMKL